MSDFEQDDMEMEEPVVVMTDEEGNEYYYIEEEVIAVGDKRFAILIPVDTEGEQEHEHCGDCECGCGEDEAVIAKIEKDENGEDVYCNPTDEEFEEVLRIYEERDEEEA